MHYTSQVELYGRTSACVLVLLCGLLQCKAPNGLDEQKTELFGFTLRIPQGLYMTDVTTSHKKLLLARNWCKPRALNYITWFSVDSH